MKKTVCALLFALAAFGVSSGSAQKTQPTGRVSIGYRAGMNITTGSDDTCLGYQSCENLTTGSYDICLGAHSCDNLTNGNDDICIGPCPLTTESGMICIHGSCAPNGSGVPQATLNYAIRELLKEIQNPAAAGPPQSCPPQYDDLRDGQDVSVRHIKYQ